LAEAHVIELIAAVPLDDPREGGPWMAGSP
jgi:hypothetical protein